MRDAAVRALVVEHWEVDRTKVVEIYLLDIGKCQFNREVAIDSH